MPILVVLLLSYDLYVVRLSIESRIKSGIVHDCKSLHPSARTLINPTPLQRPLPRGSTSINLISLHQFVLQYTIREIPLSQRCCMTPRFLPILFSDCGRKTGAPLLPWECRDYVVDSTSMNEICITTNIIFFLYQQPIHKLSFWARAYQELWPTESITLDS